jgi:hypothetical protein
MKQADIDRAVARATGETVEEVRHRGFGLIITPSVPYSKLANPAHEPSPAQNQARRSPWKQTSTVGIS